MRRTRFSLWRLGTLLLFVLSAGASMIAGCDCQDTVGVTLDAEIQSIPKTLVFESVAIGQQLTREVVVKNIGRGGLIIKELSIVNESAGEPFQLLTKKDLPLEIAPGASERLQVRYEPKRAGIARGHIRTVSNAENSDSSGVYKIDLRSTELSADISVTPNPVDFGAVKPNDTKTLKVKILNKGSATLELFSAEFEKNVEKEFVMVTNLAYPVAIDPGKSVEMELSYSPKKQQADEYLIIRNNSKATERFRLRLVGAMAAPDIEVKPLKLVFDKTAVGTKGVKTFEIINNGSDVLEVSGITLGAGTSADFNLPSLPSSWPLVIDPKSSKQIEVEYNSSDTKDDTGTVKIASNDPDSPEVKVELEGKAQGCNLIAAPTQLHFVKADRKQVSIINQGNRPCTYKGAYFSQTTSKEFSFFLPPPAAQVISPGQKLDFLVKFSPTDAKDDNGELIIESDDPDSPMLKVKITSKLASANLCELVPNPTILQFGFVATGRSRQLPVVLTNNGYGDCFVTKLTITTNPGNSYQVRTQIPAQGQVIPSGSKFSINIALTPAQAGTLNGELTITSNDSRGKPIIVKLVGSSGKLCLEALPDPMDFGAVKVGCSSGLQSMEIFNVCNSSVQVTGLKFGANTNKKQVEFSIKQAPTFPRAVPFGQSITVKLSYVARDLGADLGTLEIANTLVGQSPIVVTLRGEGVNTDAQKDVFKQLNKPEIDILFDVDDSCSMSNDQSNLANNFTSFVKWASSLQVDFHIGVITTDTGKRGCLRGSPKFVTPQTPNLTTAFGNNVRVGTSGSASERGLETSYQALTAPSLTGCNAGFYRQNASLSVIYVSDERDQSPQAVNFYINFLRSLKGIRNPDKIRASAIGPTPLATCQSSSSCRYYEVTKTLRGIYEHISSANWGATLSNLGAVTFGYRTQFFLSRPADPSSIQVKVNGQVIPQGTNGWTYDANNNSVNFSKNAVPSAGALIEISYNALCLPP